MALRKLKCATCGAQLHPETDAHTVTCAYCRTQFQVPTAPATPQTQALPSATQYLPRGALIGVFIVPGVLLTIGVGVAVVVGVVSQQAAQSVQSATSGVEMPPGLAQAKAAADRVRARAAAAGGGEGGLAGQLDRYAGDCLNRFSERAFSSRTRYLSWVDPEKGPGPGARHVYGLYSLYEPQRCEEAITEAGTMDPKRPKLREAGRRYASALTDLNALVQEATVYYDRANYEDDDFARGQELHQPLLEAFADFEKAHRALAAAVDAAHADYVTQRKAELEKAGDPKGVLVLESRLAARELVDMVNVPWDELDGIDADALVARAEGYERLVDELQTQIDASPSDDPFDRLPRYAEKSAAFASSAKELMRRVRDDEGFDHGEQRTLSGSPGAHWMVDGSPGKVVAKYNELADESPSPELRQVMPVALLPAP